MACQHTVFTGMETPVCLLEVHAGDVDIEYLHEFTVWIWFDRGWNGAGSSKEESERRRQPFDFIQGRRAALQRSKRVGVL
ncbi:MAG: hypothetical protein A2498_15445 [Lentisphaerae bacterium RIFOXYC12_FULL_60_16]|nr:MAG: hypothetical protein A2498_15445 [Lentisphaerae bacterium RIFOXYC12_FULL_60_16]